MTYDAGSVQVLENRDAVRQRPGMYIGGTGKKGFHHLVWEIVDNAVDEAMNGHASVIEVTLHEDSQTVTVRDDGRGIPVAEHPDKGVSTLQVILTVLHAGAKFSEGSYGASGGLHGVGASVVNFLSEHLEVTVRRDGTEWRQTYLQGTPTGNVEQAGSCRKRDTGTEITFKPDPEVFGSQEFDADLIRDRLEIKTYLNAGMRIVFRNEGEDTEEVFQHDGGVREYLELLVKKAKVPPVHTEPIVLETEAKHVRLEIAFQWTEDTNEAIESFANMIPTASGGTHENGFRAGLARAMKSVLDVHGSVPKSLDIASEDIREGLKAVVSVIFSGDMEIEGQTKERLNNPEIQSIVSGALKPFLEQWLLNKSSVAEAVCKRIVQAAKARAASRSASKQVRRKKPSSKKLTLPGKLADCASNDVESCELFIVEGDSAGGNAKQARDRKTQAVLPLRGKVLNTESASMKSILRNKEIGDIVEALGSGMDDKFNLDKLRYGKVILLMDADSDGHHIATLLLTFFYRYMQPLVKAGRLYIAQPPLFKVVSGTDIFWATDEAEKQEILDQLGSKASKVEVSRFKGLGEMMKDTLKETALDPSSRNLLQVEVPDDLEEVTDETIQALLGRSSRSRYDFIVENLETADDLDF